MRLLIKCAIVAIPAEIFIFGIFSYPVDDGYGPDTTFTYRLLSHLWLILHWPGLLTLHWLELRGASALSELAVFVMGGYFQMTLLLFIMALAVRSLLRRSRHRAVVSAD